MRLRASAPEFVPLFLRDSNPHPTVAVPMMGTVFLFPPLVNADENRSAEENAPPPTVGEVFKNQVAEVIERANEA